MNESVDKQVQLGKLPGIFVVSGLLVLIFAIFFTPLLLASLWMTFERESYKPDTFVVEYYSEQGDSTSFGGHVESSGEPYASSHAAIVGNLAFVRKLEKENKLQGYRAPILYIQKPGPLGDFIHLFTGYRIIPPEQLEAARLPLWLTVVGVLWISGIYLFRRGFRLATKTLSEQS